MMVLVIFRISCEVGYNACFIISEVETKPLLSGNRKMSLSRQSIRNSTYLKDSSGIEVLHVDEPHALIMAAGYLKFTLAKGRSEGIYFRGQRKIYEGLTPTLYREVSSLKVQHTRHGALNEMVKGFANTAKIFNAFGSYAHEALLQHYGINTTWVDLVDNVWVALWFSCHQAMSAGKNGEFVHFERRLPTGGSEYAYLLLVAVDITQRSREKPGYFHGNQTELVDLRMAAPSVFLRPHAQHGLLFRKKADSCTGRDLDYSSQIRGIIRVDLAKALDWLGSGKMVNTHSLFPPPFYDNGYQILLNCGVEGEKSVGKISHIGA